MIGTPSYDGKLDVWYVNSLLNTIKMAQDQDVEILPMWVSFDALVQRARNDTLQMAISADVDDLIFIDYDIEWKPEWIFQLLNYPVDVVGGTYPKKGLKEEYVVRQLVRTPPDARTGLMQVQGLGTGFVRLSQKALRHLWDSSASYVDPKDNLERRMAFNVVLHDGGLMSEDIYMFEQLMKGGFQIWLDPQMTCNHVGPHKFKGDFQRWYARQGMRQL
jgi:hypothetical protein